MQKKVKCQNCGNSVFYEKWKRYRMCESCAEEDELFNLKMMGYEKS